MLKRIFLFLFVNLAVIVILLTITSVFGIAPYLTPYGLNLTSLAIFAGIIGFAGSFISLFFSKWMAKRMVRMHIIKQPRNHAEARLFEVVSQLAKQQNIKMPEVGIYQSQEVNAFATGPTRNSALVAVSTGLLEMMNEHELEGVLAHEMAHISNGDMITMTLIQGVINTFVIFAARVLAFAIQNALGRGGRVVGGFAYFGTAILLEIVFGIFASTIVYWFSRRREFRADLGGAKSVGKAKMIAALQKLKGVSQLIDTRQKTLATLKINDRPSRFSRLFSSHPPIEERIQALEKAMIS